MDTATALVQQVEDCRGGRLIVVGHGTKPVAFDPTAEQVDTLSTIGHTGILDYRPEELVITARAGTPLEELASVVAEKDQLLPFDPPRFGGKGTFGGAIGSGLSGPARPWRGSIRDAVLGVELINGLAERLRFGGSVMKNVAGYDVSRLVTGAAGTLGVILSASVRLLPKPEVERTFAVSCSPGEAAERCQRWARLPLPITGTCHVHGTLAVRLSGSLDAVEAGRAEMGFTQEIDGDFWVSVRDLDHPFFSASDNFACLSGPGGMKEQGRSSLVAWGGRQMWYETDSDMPATTNAMTFRRQPGGWRITHPPRDPVVAKYVERVRLAFDPDGMFAAGTASDAHPDT